MLHRLGRLHGSFSAYKAARQRVVTGGEPPGGALTLTAVATKAGLSYQMISYVERGLRVPGLDTLLRITSALEIDPADLLKRAMLEVSRTGEPYSK